MVDALMSSYGASERHVRRVLCVTRGTYRYRVAAIHGVSC